MDTIWFYIVLGFNHVTDLEGLDHFYFITALALPYSFRKFPKLIWWVTLFTIGHTLSLIGNYYLKLPVSSYWIELFIPVTIAFGCIPLLLQKKLDEGFFASVLTLVFGGIHGLGFGRYFSLVVDQFSPRLSLLSFALGVEFAQIGIVFLIIFLNYIIAKNFQALKYWRLGMGILIFILALVMIVERF